MKRSSSRSPLTAQTLYNRLFKHFGPQQWWPAETPWEMMVGAFLTQNTAWTNVEKALAALKRTSSLSLLRIAMLPRKRLEQLIRPAGFFRQKAARLQAFARLLKNNPSFYRRLRGLGISPREAKVLADDLRHHLLAQKGIGPETADSMLLYAGKYPVFVVDAYTRRIGKRLGLFKTDDYDEVQRFFESSLPRRPQLFNEFHALLVMLAKHFCKSRNPRCMSCPTGDLCEYKRKAA